MTALLFVDFETTELDVSFATVLEGAWVITNLDGRLRHPMQHRYMALHNRGPKVIPIHPKSEKPRWLNYEQRMSSSQYARQMAENSLLFGDYLSCNPNLILQHGAELTRLLFDDISSYTASSGETVHICGAGAARFDYSILSIHCPQLIPDKGQGLLSYRPVDTSGNMTGLTGDKNESAVIKSFLSSPDCFTDIELDVSPRFSYSNRDVQSWLAGSAAHRAAPDVARSIVTQRALWLVGEPLRQALASVRSS